MLLRRMQIVLPCGQAVGFRVELQQEVHRTSALGATGTFPQTHVTPFLTACPHRGLPAVGFALA